MSATETATVEISALTMRWMQIEAPLAVCKSAAGYYLGCVATEELCEKYPEKLEFPGEPLSRDSQEYWSTEQEAIDALASGNWTQRPTP